MAGIVLAPDEFLHEESAFPEQVRMISIADPVVGGKEGPTNIAINAVANRTQYLKALCIQISQSIPGTEEFDKIYQEIANLDVAKLDGRMDHVERLIGNIMLSLQAANMSPTGYDGMMTETFDGDAEEIDQTSTIITSIVSGDDSIDVESTENLQIGLHYEINDGENQEPVQIKNINIASGVNRVILTDSVKKQYVSGRAKLYRSSIAIYNGKAYGGGSIKTDVWEPNKTFSGSTTAQDVSTEINYNDETIFDLQNATVENGKIILGSSTIGLVLVSEGNTAGTWQRVDENGDDIE